MILSMGADGDMADHPVVGSPGRGRFLWQGCWALGLREKM